jgi:glycosyltransferase involved in cell wall biosynthesis
MPRFAGVRDNNIRVVSDSSFLNEHLSVIEVPSDLNTVSSSELIANYRVRDGKIVLRKEKKSVKNMKVALVSNWKMKCGIATYANFLFNELIPEFGDYKLFIEESEFFTSSPNALGDLTIPDDKISICWKRGESLTKLIAEIKAYDPDIVLIQHEFGLYPNSRYFLSLMNQLSEFRVIVTMHSVFHHKDKTICEAAMPEIIVHLEGAKEVLVEEKGLASKVHVVPHGCFPCEDTTRLWNFYKSEHTFIQFGFSYRYKGYENALKATAILKKKYKDVFFTGLCSESPYSKIEHEIYYRELMQIVDDLDIQENVGLIRGYQSDQVLDSYLRINKAAIFPYISNNEHECFGSSGAAPFSMTKAIPVISSSVNHFKSLPTIKADSPEEIAEALDKLFSNKKLVENQLELQVAYLEENSWRNTALRYIKIFEE